MTPQLLIFAPLTPGAHPHLSTTTTTITKFLVEAAAATVQGYVHRCWCVCSRPSLSLVREVRGVYTRTAGEKRKEREGRRGGTEGAAKT